MKEKFTPEAFVHLVVHFFGVVFLFGLAIVPPLWVALVAIVAEKIHLALLGNCVLTKFAHSRGYMKGMTYWQYVPRLLGVADYKKADRIISGTITYAIAGILLFRTALALLT